MRCCSGAQWASTVAGVASRTRNDGPVRRPTRWSDTSPGAVHPAGSARVASTAAAKAAGSIGMPVLDLHHVGAQGPGAHHRRAARSRHEPVGGDERGRHRRVVGGRRGGRGGRARLGGHGAGRWTWSRTATVPGASGSGVARPPRGRRPQPRRSASRRPARPDHEQIAASAPAIGPRTVGRAFGRSGPAPLSSALRAPGPSGPGSRGSELTSGKARVRVGTAWHNSSTLRRVLLARAERSREAAKRETQPSWQRRQSWARRSG